MPYLGELSALFTALLWSVSSFIFTSVSIRLGAIQLNLWRMLLACVFIFITALIFHFDYTVSLNQIIFLAISGIIGLVLGDTFLFKAFSTIGPRVSMLIMALNPGIAAILAFIFLNENLSLFGILGIIITISGISIVILEKESNTKTRFAITKAGLLYAFLGAVGQGIQLIFAKIANIESDINPFVATFIRIFAAIIVLAPVLLFKKPERKAARVPIEKKIYWFIIIGSIMGPYLGITFSYIAIVHSKIGIASTLMTTSPIMMLPLTYFIYKEKLGWKAIIGAFIAVAGVSVLFLS